MHRKRLSVPSSWPVPSKTHRWIYKTRPGPHGDGIPLGVILRDFLGLTQTSRETESVIKAKKVLVDGKPRREAGFPVGFMDVISVPSIKKQFRMVSTPKGLKPLEIDEKEASKKLVKVVNKTTVKGGKEQSTSHDGRNFLKNHPMRSTLLISLPDQKVEKVMEMKEGALVNVLSGRYQGALGKLLPVTEALKKKGTVFIEVGDKKIEVPQQSAFVVGYNQPEVKLE